MIPHEGGEIGLGGLGLREEEGKGSGGLRDESGVIHPGWVVARIMVLIFSYNRASALEKLTFHFQRVWLFALYRYLVLSRL